MNPSGVIALLIALVVAYFAFSGSGILTSGTGPLATGPGYGTGIRNPQPVSSGGGFFGASTQTSEKPQQLPPGVSPYKGVVSIDTVSRFSNSPAEEYIVIHYSSGFFSFSGSGGNQTGVRPIDVTGWTIGTPRSSALIPRAFNIAEIDAADQDIILPPGGNVVIVTGTPSYQQNFRENACTGYFNQTHTFTPSLSSSCIDETPSRSALLGMGFNGACINAIESVSSCRTPQGPFDISSIKSECVDYMNQNFSYVGCVKNFRDSKDFLKDTWRISFKRDTKLFDPLHDRVILRDRAGLLVDEFEY